MTAARCTGEIINECLINAGGSHGDEEWQTYSLNCKLGPGGGGKRDEEATGSFLIVVIRPVAFVYCEFPPGPYPTN